MPSELMTDVEVARVVHMPSSRTRIGFWFHMPSLICLNVPFIGSLPLRMNFDGVQGHVHAIRHCPDVTVAPEIASMSESPA